MAVVIQDFEAVQAQDSGSGDSAGKSRPALGPVANAALDRLLTARRARHFRRWAS